MVPITFGGLGTAACAFLIYVFVQLRREFLKETSIKETTLTPAEIYRMEAAWKLASTSPHIVRRRPEKATGNAA